MPQPVPVTPASPNSVSGHPVEFVRPEVVYRYPQWERIRAALGGEMEVKRLREKILPRPNPADTTPENLARYEGYMTRAVWYGVSGRTLNGLAGYVFAKEPVVKLPAELASIEDNIDGTGVTLNQQAKEALRHILSLGRAGLLVDYPTSITPETGETVPTTRQQLLDGNMAPVILLYNPEQITNWRSSYVGAKSVLDIIVLKENKSIVGDDEFTLGEQLQYRVLHRDETGVHGRIFRKENDSAEIAEILDEAYDPKDSAGKPLMEIPFTFLGAVNNDSIVDTPPMLDLVDLNFAHFRNSADYEESCYLVGQPTPWVSGLTEGWVKEVLHGQIQLGSRAIIPLPVGGQAGLLQASPNSLPKEAMDAKEKQMLALGAKLVEQTRVQRTATEVGMDHTADVSVLSSAATNMFLGYEKALGFACQFVGVADASVEFELTDPLTQDVISQDLANGILALKQGGLINFEEARSALKKTGVAYLDDDKVKTEIENEGLPPGPNNVVPPGNPGQPPKVPALPAPAK